MAFLGAFIIANVMTMVVLERTREIGIFLSMGMPSSRILGLFLVEGTLLGFFGSAIGALAGLGVNFAISKTGLDMTGAMAGFSWPLDNVIRPSVGLGPILVGVLMGTVVSAAVAYLPSRKAAGLAPVEAIKGR